MAMRRALFALLVGSVSGACDPSCGTCSTYKPITAVECDTDRPQQADWDSYLIDDGDTLIVSRSDFENACVGWQEVFQRLELQKCDVHNPTACQRWDVTTDAYTRNEDCVAFQGETGGCLDIHNKVGPEVQLTKCYDNPNDRLDLAGGSWFSEDSPPTYPQRCLEANEIPCTNANCCTGCGDGRHLTEDGYCDLDVPREKQVNLFLALSNNDTYMREELMPILVERRKSYTGIIYQWLTLCYEGADPSSCDEADRVGPPHLAVVRGADLDVAALLEPLDVRLFPILSLGNPGNASKFVELARNPELVHRFVRDAVGVLKAHNLTGLNFDMEISGSTHGLIEPFLKAVYEGLHAEGFQVTWDGFGLKPAGVTVPLDSYIFMSTYMTPLPDYARALAKGAADVGDRMGVGLCPTCADDTEDVVKQRFDLLYKTPRAREIDLWSLWGRSDHGQYNVKGWEHYWPALETWLNAP